MLVFYGTDLDGDRLFLATVFVGWPFAVFLERQMRWS